MTSPSDPQEESSSAALMSSGPVMPTQGLRTDSDRNDDIGNRASQGLIYESQDSSSIVTGEKRRRRDEPLTPSKKIRVASQEEGFKGLIGISPDHSQARQLLGKRSAEARAQKKGNTALMLDADEKEQILNEQTNVELMIPTGGKKIMTGRFGGELRKLPGQDQTFYLVNHATGESLRISRPDPHTDEGRIRKTRLADHSCFKKSLNELREGCVQAAFCSPLTDAEFRTMSAPAVRALFPDFISKEFEVKTAVARDLKRDAQGNFLSSSVANFGSNPDNEWAALEKTKKFYKEMSGICTRAAEKIEKVEGDRLLNRKQVSKADTKEIKAMTKDLNSIFVEAAKELSHGERNAFANALHDQVTATGEFYRQGLAAMMTYGLRVQNEMENWTGILLDVMTAVQMEIKTLRKFELEPWMVEALVPGTHICQCSLIKEPPRHLEHSLIQQALRHVPSERTEILPDEYDEDEDEDEEEEEEILTPETRDAGAFIGVLKGLNIKMIEFEKQGVSPQDTAAMMRIIGTLYEDTAPAVTSPIGLQQAAILAEQRFLQEGKNMDLLRLQDSPSPSEYWEQFVRDGNARVSEIADQWDRSSLIKDETFPLVERVQQAIQQPWLLDLDHLEEEVEQIGGSFYRSVFVDLAGAAIEMAKDGETPREARVKVRELISQMLRNPLSTSALQSKVMTILPMDMEFTDAAGQYHCCGNDFTSLNEMQNHQRTNRETHMDSEEEQKWFENMLENQLPQPTKDFVTVDEAQYTATVVTVKSRFPRENNDDGEGAVEYCAESFNDWPENERLSRIGVNMSEEQAAHLIRWCPIQRVGDDPRSTTNTYEDELGYVTWEHLAHNRDQRSRENIEEDLRTVEDFLFNQQLLSRAENKAADEHLRQWRQRRNSESDEVYRQRIAVYNQQLDNCRAATMPALEAVARRMAMYQGESYTHEGEYVTLPSYSGLRFDGQWNLLDKEDNLLRNVAEVDNYLIEHIADDRFEPKITLPFIDALTKRRIDVSLALLKAVEADSGRYQQQVEILSKWIEFAEREQESVEFKYAASEGHVSAYQRNRDREELERLRREVTLCVTKKDLIDQRIGLMQKYRLQFLNATAKTTTGGDS